MMRLLTLLTALLMAAPATAQSLDLPAPSPAAEVSQTIGVLKATVSYSSPGKKGREIWGGLVPHDTLWRLGANGATTLELSADVKIAGQAVPAGKYALFAIPGATEWTIIVNKNPNQGGTRQYDAALDQARIKVKPAPAGARERLTFVFSDTTDSTSALDLLWDGIRVRIPITADTATLAGENIKTYSGKASRNLANAARYYIGKKDWAQALKLIDASLASSETWFNVWIKADILAKKGDFKAAYPLAKKAHALGLKSKNFFYKGKVEKALKTWKSK